MIFFSIRPVTCTYFSITNATFWSHCFVFEKWNIIQYVQYIYSYGHLIKPEGKEYGRAPKNCCWRLAPSSLKPLLDKKEKKEAELWKNKLSGLDHANDPKAMLNTCGPGGRYNYGTGRGTARSVLCGKLKIRFPQKCTVQYNNFTMSWSLGILCVRRFGPKTRKKDGPAQLWPRAREGPITT